MQSMFPAVARYRVYGYVNVNFIYTMAIFPFVWIVGFIFVLYIRKVVYPLERELNSRFQEARNLVDPHRRQNPFACSILDFWNGKTCKSMSSK
jgi:hypothetical protein